MMNFTKRLGLILVLCVAGLGAQTLTPEMKRKVVEDVTRVIEEKAFVPGLDMDAWTTHVEKHKKDLDAATTHDAFAKGLNKACKEFGISHLNVRTPDQEKRRTTRQGAGFGIRVANGDKVLHVIEVNPNGPSVGKGIDAGDDIVLVDGRVPEEIEDLQGDVGTKATLRVRKPDGTEVDLELERKSFSLDRPDTLTWVDDESAVLKIHTFMQGYKRDVIAGLAKEAAKAKHLVLDLRGNGGGQVSNLRHLLGFFLPSGTAVGAFIGRNVVKQFVEAGRGDGKDPAAVAAWSPRKFRTDRNQNPVITARVAVLTDRGSASASEITSAALRDILDAPLVGTSTAGAVLASTYERIEGGYSVQYPASDYITVKGRRLEKQPLVPDIDLGPASRPASRTATASRPRPVATRPSEDTTVMKALALLRTREPKPDPSLTASRPAPLVGGDDAGDDAPESRPRRTPTSRPGRRRGGD